MNIYVGNLSLGVTEGELRREFSSFGDVLSVIIMNDNYISSGQSRGYAYIEMPSQSEGKAAITGLNGKTLRDMVINVIQALPLSDHGGNSSHIDVRFSWPKSKVRQRAQY